MYTTIGKVVGLPAPWLPTEYSTSSRWSRDYCFTKPVGKKVGAQDQCPINTVGTCHYRAQKPSFNVVQVIVITCPAKVKSFNVSRG